MSLYFDNGDNTQTIYISERIRDKLCATFEDQLVIDDNPETIGQARFSTMDMQFYADPLSTLYPQYPLYKNYIFTNNNNINQTFKKTGVLTEVSNAYYTESNIERWTTWVYFPSTVVYCLVYKNPLKIYAMQNYSNYVDNTINYSNLSLLANKLNLPEGWIFTYMSLDKDTYLTVPSNGNAIVVSDEYQGSYMYIQPKSAPWLYSIYSSN
jgi:hypothetical protein